MGNTQHTTLILDELGWDDSFRTPKVYANKVKLLMDKNPNLRVILGIGITDETKNEIQTLNEELSMQTLKIGRKAFNGKQAGEYISLKLPQLLDLDEQTIDDIVQYFERSKKEYGDLYHFRWIRKAIGNIDWIFPYDHQNGDKFTKAQLESIRGDLTEEGILTPSQF